MVERILMASNLTFLVLDERSEPRWEKVTAHSYMISWLKVRKKEVDSIKLGPWTFWFVKIVISLNNISVNF